MLPGNGWHGRDLWLRLIVIAVVALAVAVVCHFFWHLRPVNRLRMVHNTVMVERQSWYEITSGGNTLLFFGGMSPDTLFSQLSLNRDSAVRHDYSAGCWISRWALVPSCHGRIITSFAAAKQIEGDAKDLIINERAYLNKRIRSIKGIRHELIYYIRSHAASDEGFNLVASYNVLLSHEQAKERKLLNVIDRIKSGSDVKFVRHEVFTARYYDYVGKLKMANCYKISDDEKMEIVLLRAHDGITPIDVLPVALSPFTSLERGDSMLAVGFGGLNLQKSNAEMTLPVIVPGVCLGEKSDIPMILTGRGAPVFSIKGRFIGISTGKRLIEREQISKLFKERGDKE